jgi:hypothetical protein
LSGSDATKLVMSSLPANIEEQDDKSVQRLSVLVWAEGKPSTMVHTIVARTKNNVHGVSSQEVSNLWLGSQTSVPKPKTLVRNILEINLDDPASALLLSKDCLKDDHAEAIGKFPVVSVRLCRFWRGERTRWACETTISWQLQNSPGDEKENRTSESAGFPSWYLSLRSVCKRAR